MKLSQGLFTIAKSPLGDFIVGLSFGKFSSLLPIQKVMEIDMVIAFWHPKPFWEEHILIVPKKAIKNISSLQESDAPYLSAVYTVASSIVKDLEWEKSGYTILANGGNRQEVHQLHFHLWRGQERNQLF